jgi:hypothetical protein
MSLVERKKEKHHIDIPKMFSFTPGIFSVFLETK